MKKKIQKIVVIIIAVIATFLYAHISKTHCIYNTELDTSNYMDVVLLEDVVISQQFTTSENTLDGVRIKTRVNGDASAITVQYILNEVGTEEKIASGSVNGADIENSKFVDYAFSTVENTFGKKYEFTIWAEGGTDSNNIVLCYEGVNENGTDLEISGQEWEGTLILKTVTKRFDIETFCVLLIFIIYIVLFFKFLYRLFEE